MSEPPTPVPPPAPTTPKSEPPEGGERRRLDRPPGNRYAEAAPSTSDGAEAEAEAVAAGGARRRPLVVAVLVADAGALLFFGLCQVNLGWGLLVVAAVLGWATALALVWRGRESAIGDSRLRASVAALLGGWAVAGGLLLDWVYALVQGGALGLLDYVGERFGLVAPLAIAVAAVVALVRAR